MTWRATNYDAVKKGWFLFRLRARGARFDVPPRALAPRGAVNCRYDTHTIFKLLATELPCSRFVGADALPQLLLTRQ